MENDLFTVCKYPYKREDMNQCEPNIIERYTGKGNVYRFRPKSTNKSLPVPNPLQEAITEYLDKQVDTIKDWLDREDPQCCHKIIKIPFFISPNPAISWKDETDISQLNSELLNISKIDRFCVYLRRRKLLIALDDKIAIWCYAGVTEYGHIILGKIRQRNLITTAITEKGIRLDE
jgi:hypothetical protein